jgi:hypothetical protein
MQNGRELGRRYLEGERIEMMKKKKLTNATR